MIGSVRNRQTKSRMKYRTGPINTAKTDVGAECPELISWEITGTADRTIR